MAGRQEHGRGTRGWGIAVLAIAVMAAGRAASGQGARLGAFDGHGDVGSPKIAGSATYNAVSQEYALAAGGVNMWARRDEFHFVWKSMTGDFILQARVELLGKGVDPHRKAGWMIRPSQDADAPYVDGVIHGDGLTSLQFRRTKGAITEQKEMAIKGPTSSSSNARAAPISSRPPSTATPSPSSRFPMSVSATRSTSASRCARTIRT